MQIPKEARIALFDYIDAHPDLSQDEAINFLLPHLMFDIGELKRQYVKRRVSAYMAQKRDLSGTREILAAKMPDETLYVLVKKSENISALQAIVSNLNKQIDGARKSMRKAKKRLDRVVQMTFEDVQRENEVSGNEEK